MPLSLLIVVALLVISAIWVFSYFYRRHVQGENAPRTHC